MEEFLNNLYSYEYFGFYLIISIIVLIILFIIILFFGKKDQKVREIEATKKLQQLNSDAFKEEPMAEKLEINNNVEQEKLENDTIIMPSIEDVPSINSVEENNEIPEPVIPVVSEEVVNDIPVEEPKIEEPVIEIEETPLLEKVEEKPLVFEDTTEFNKEFEEIVAPEPVIELESVEPTLEEIEVPEFNFDEIVKDVEEVKLQDTKVQGPQIFSSVYVPEKEVEIPKVEIEVPTSEELDFELPVLKKEVAPEPKEEKIEVPELNDYNLDNLSGESYNIK